MGRALAPLREEGILVIGSGSITHNLYELARGPRVIDAPVPDWVSSFGNWVNDRVEAGALDDLVAYRERGPFAKENHPSEEHYLPLPFAMAAAGPQPKGRRVHSSGEYGLLMMDTYAFD
jgi:4,5-DOPA dioxygenase extradiol